MISIKPPQFKKTLIHLRKREQFDPRPILEWAGEIGVNELSKTTPKDTNETAAAWSYKIEGGPGRYKLIWTNSVMAGQAPLVLLLQYGHMTKNGYFLQGQDFINPALEPVYIKLNKRLIEEVLK